MLRRRFNGAKRITEVQDTFGYGRGALRTGRSGSGSDRGLYGSENAGMSSENCVRIIMAENLRFPGVGSSAPGQPGAKARPEGVVDAHTVEIPWPLNNLKLLTRRWNLTRQLVSGPEKGTEIQVGKQAKPAARKGSCML